MNNPFDNLYKNINESINNADLDFLGVIAIAANFLQVSNYLENIYQTQNIDIIKAIEGQNLNYLDELLKTNAESLKQNKLIIEQNELIIQQNEVLMKQIKDIKGI